MCEGHIKPSPVGYLNGEDALVGPPIWFKDKDFGQGIKMKAAGFTDGSSEAGRRMGVSHPHGPICEVANPAFLRGIFGTEDDNFR